MSDWNRETFARWLKMQRRVLNPMSQEKLAEKLGVTQSRVSRWEGAETDVDAPTLDECLRFAEIYEVDFIELAKLVGRWNDDLSRRVLVSLASNGDPELSDAPVAQVTDIDVYRELRAVVGL